MSLMDKLKSTTQSLFSKKSKTPDRRRKGTNFHDAKSVALLYVDKDEEHFKRIKSYVKYLHDEFGIRRVLAYGYVNQSEKTIPLWQTHKLEFDFFTPADLSWSMQPGQSLQTFINEEFDVLIDTSAQDCDPLRFVLQNSHAKMKVGWDKGAGSEFCDLMISIDSYDFDRLLEQTSSVLTNMTLV
ncbi:MAG: hypothetical protein KDC12_08030 [Flavobacteriales bacterium]|nr:hypothetical protein [Flavobacteriales bacterium]